MGSQFLGAQTHPLVSMCFSLVVVISLALLISLIVVFIMLISLLSCLQERTTGASLVARMRGDARARARREQRARVQGGRVGARARQRRGRSREEFPVRTFVLSSSRSQISVTLSSVDSELFQNIHNFDIRSRVSAPRPTAPSVACAWLRVHAVSLPPFPSLVLAL